MKISIVKIILFISLTPVLVFGQKDSLRMSFTALSGGQHIALDSVFIENLSQGGDTLLAAPDTVLWLFWESSGMPDAATKDLQAQVYPNPFAGSTKLTVFLPRESPINITAYDMLGRVKADYTQRHSAGVHSFTFVGGSAQAYLLAVHNEDQRQVFKVLQKGRSTERPGISYMQEVPAVASVQAVKKSKAVFPWSPGDALHITGFATLPVSGPNADTIILSPYADTLLTFVFPHEVLPSVITAPVTNITFYTAEGGGTVTDTGSATVTVRGICWSMQPNPTIADNHTVDSAGLGNFISFITGLASGVSYYVRAYATNQYGTAYGNEVVFATLAVPCGLPFTDPRDGNIYNTVMLGDQCWMSESLRYLPAVFPGNSVSETQPRYYVYGYMGIDTAQAKLHTVNHGYPIGALNMYHTYGVMYNWPAVMQGDSSSNSIPSGVQGVCPPGWHVPSDNQWLQLESFLGTTPGAKLAGGDSLWGSGSIIASFPDFGSSGFNALPGGRLELHAPGIYFGGRGTFSNFATATDYNCPYNAFYIRAIISHSTTGSISNACFPYLAGIYLRCVQD